MRYRILPLLALSLLPLQAQDSPTGPSPANLPAADSPATAAAAAAEAAARAAAASSTGETTTPSSPTASTTSKLSYASNDSGLESFLVELKKEAESGKPEAAQRLAAQYAIGGHFEQARAWALKYLDLLRAKAEAGDLVSMLTLGSLSWRGGQFTQPDHEAAMHWFRMAADKGDVRGFYIMGEAYREAGQPDKANEAFQQAYRIYADRVTANPEDTEALYWQGYMETQGEGTAAQLQSGIDKLNQAADAGNVWALEYLFKIYTDGKLLPADKPKAMEYAKRVVDTNGSAPMAYMLACYYMNVDGAARPGQPVDENNAEGLKYLDIAAKANNVSAITHRADILRRQGKLAEALQGYQQAASMQQPQALLAAADLLLNGGEGLERDPDTALRYLQTAVIRYHDGDAANMLADFYRSQGENALANHWIVQASDDDCAAAMARRGLLHLSPLSGLAWDPTLTYQWWVKGREMGDPTCALCLNLYFFVFIPLLLVIVFIVPVLLVKRLHKRAKEQGEA